VTKIRFSPGFCNRDEINGFIHCIINAKTMKKLFFAWIMALWCFPAVFAQSGQGIRYQGEVGVGTAFGVGSNAYDRFVLETVHGVRIGPRLFVGLGVAWNYYSARGDMPDDSFKEYTDGGRSFVPIFADMKIYFLDRRISPPLSESGHRLRHPQARRNLYRACRRCEVRFGECPGTEHRLRIPGVAADCSRHFERSGRYHPACRVEFLGPNPSG